MTRTAVARDMADLDRLSPAWDALADAVDAPLFSRPFWCIPWAQHLRAGHPSVAARFDGTELTGVAPLATRSIGGIELVRFLGHGFGTVTGLVHDPRDRASSDDLWSTMLAGRRRFAQLLELRGDDTAAAGPADWPHEASPHDVCLTVDCTTTYDTYMRSRPKKLRQNLRRAERAALADPPHTVELVTTLDRWLAVRREVIEIFDAAEGARPRLHLFRGPLGGFTDQLLATSAAAGRLRLFIGRVGDRPMSFGIAFAVRSTLSFWVTRFDPRGADGSVGVRLLKSVIEHGFREGFDCVDLLLGDQPHKRRWSTHSYGTLTVTAASSAPLLGAGRLVLATAAGVRRHAPTRIAPGPRVA